MLLLLHTFIRVCRAKYQKIFVNPFQKASSVSTRCCSSPLETRGWRNSRRYRIEVLKAICRLWDCLAWYCSEGSLTLKHSRCNTEWSMSLSQKVLLCRACHWAYVNCMRVQDLSLLLTRGQLLSPIISAALCNLSVFASDQFDLLRSAA